MKKEDAERFVDLIENLINEPGDRKELTEFLIKIVQSGDDVWDAIVKATP